MRKVRESGKIMVNADKTRNIYELKKEELEKTVIENITKIYKKADPGIVQRVNFGSALTFVFILIQKLLIVIPGVLT